MILTEQQNKVIVEYLIGKGLSFDLLPEVHDHFATQLIDYTKQGNTFEQAFELVKEDWKSEFVRADINPAVFKRTYVPNLVAKTHKRERFSYFKNALYFSLPFLGLFVFFLFLGADPLRFVMLITAVVSIVLATFFNIKSILLNKQYENKINLQFFYIDGFSTIINCFNTFIWVDGLLHPSQLYMHTLGWKILYIVMSFAFIVLAFYSHFVYQKLLKSSQLNNLNY